MPKPPEEKTIIESTTDPDCGVFHKGEDKKCFAYGARTMCEKHGYVLLEVDVTPGNVHDSAAFDTVFERATEHYPEIEVVTADAGYKTPWICKLRRNCPAREQCTQNQQCVKTVTRHVWHNYIGQAADIRHSSLGKKTYALRSQTIERVFADAKEKHAMRYTPYRGLTAVTTWGKLKFAALNLKKFAIHKGCSIFHS